MDYSVRTEGFEELEAEWTALLQSSINPMVFLTPAWLKQWWEIFGDGLELCITALRRGDRLVAVAPLFKEGHKLAFLGDPSVCDYHDFVVHEDESDNIYEALFRALDDTEWKLLDLTAVQPASPTYRLVPDWARARGYSVEVVPFDVCPGLSLPISWEDYVSSLGKKDRHELRRKMRRLSEAGELKYYTVGDNHEFEQGMEDFLRLLRDSRPDKAEFLTPQVEEFFRRMGQTLARTECAKLAFLELDGKKVASILYYDYNGSYSLYNSGFDPAFSHVSVGLISKALCLKEAIESGKKRFDFMRGAEPYKYDLGGQDQPVYRITIRR